MATGRAGGLHGGAAPIMGRLRPTPLARVLRRPEQASTLALSEWELLVRQARAEALLGRVAAELDRAGLADAPPRPARRQLGWGAALARKHEADMRFEIACIRAAVAGTDAPVVFLKGAAYLLAGLPNAVGRIFSDVDILTPRAEIGRIERALVIAGWQPEKPDPYDQRYYRDWMHELPPMRHVRRGTVIDLHHAILPLTARPRIDMQRLIAAAREAPGTRRALVLAPVDMTLHAVAHAFYDGFFEHGLRDLADLDSLLRHFAVAEPAFWEELVARAHELDLARSLWYALRHVQIALDTPVPASAFSGLASSVPTAPLRALMDRLILRAAQPNHPSCDGVDMRLSRLLLYVRSHYLRMPLRLLLPHLARKAARGAMPGKNRQG